MRDSWASRSGQHWLLSSSGALFLGGGLGGTLLFVVGSGLVSFYGEVVVLMSAALAFALAALVRCSVCGRRVALDAPFGHWWRYTSTLQMCPECGDDGTGKTVTLNPWFQAVRVVAARDRLEARSRRRRRIVIAGAIAIAVVVGWLLVK